MRSEDARMQHVHVDAKDPQAGGLEQDRTTTKNGHVDHEHHGNDHRGNEHHVEIDHHGNEHHLDHEPTGHEPLPIETQTAKDSDAVAPLDRHWAADIALLRLYVQRERKFLTLAVTGAALFAGATVGWSQAIARVVDRIIRPLLRKPSTTNSLRAIDFAKHNRLNFVLLLGLIGWARLGFAALRRFNAARAAHGNSHRWRELVVNQLLRQPLSFYRQHPTGTLLGAADNDPDAAVSVLHPLPYSLGVLCLLAISLAWLLYVDIPMALVSAVVLPLTLFLNERFQKRAESPNRAVQADVARLGGVVHETVDGISAIKALGLEPNRFAKARDQIRVLRDHKLEIVRLRSTVNTLQTNMPQLVNVGLVMIGAWRVRSQSMSVGDVVGIVSLYNLMIWPLQLLAWALFEMPRSRAGAQRIQALLDVPVPSLPIARPPKHHDDILDLDGVTLVHDDGRRALDNVSLRIPRGSITAVVGATGSGKSTLLNVLAGVDVPTTGTRGTATDRISLVFQEPLVLSGTIEHNLKLGVDVEASRTGEALKVADAVEFIRALPDGIHTRLGERGVSLSGGQRQRIALARALGRENDVVLLDDTTSSLDASTEAEVLSALSTTNLAPTMILVASRPSTITYADSVVLLDAGRIVAQGTHEELLANSTQYQQLVEALNGQ